MKTTLTLTLALLTFASAGGAQGTAPVTAPTTAPKATPVMTPGNAPATDEAVIRQQYQALGNAILKQDSAAILQTYAPQFVGWGPRYEPLPREALAQATPDMALKSVQFTPLKFERQGAGYRVTAKSDLSGEYQMGEQKVPFTSSQESADLWQKVAGRWQIVQSQNLTTTMNMGGQAQQMTDPAPLSDAGRQALAGALKASLKPINVADSANDTGKSDDLGYLKALAPARVIGVGEGSHGTHEHFVLKARIFKALVQQYGFTTLAFESNMAGAEAINAYISGQSGDLQAAVSGLGFKVWRTAEIRDLLTWMREYNAKRGGKPALTFVGVDMQDPGGSARLLAQLGPALKDAAAPFAALEPYQIDALVQDGAKRDTFVKQTDALVKAAAALPADAPRRADVQALARTVQQAVLAATGQGTRDDFMAENMLAALKAHPQARAMLWAHNGHISKAPDPLSQTGMGQRLAAALGRDYRTIGQTFSNGTISAVVMGQEDKGLQPVPVAPAHPDSPEALAGPAPAALVLSDLKTPTLNDYFATPRPLRGIGQSTLPGAAGYTFEVLPKAYDVLIFTGKSTPTKPAN